ncbi:class I SAM-dependent methyltransferase [Streptomyces violascens]|uniref:class I SAM-dependent methyltransferase n=1 Tax=Streptomyces violascens TaxID=67381 RepID=UPI0036BA59D0
MNEKLATQSIQASFDAVAGLYERFAEITEGSYTVWLKEILGTGGRNAVDLGCGSGQFTGMLADRYEQVLGVDISVAQLEIALRKNKHGNITYSHRDILEVTPERDGHFDLVLSVTALHHVPDVYTALQRVRDLVTEGGTVVVIDVVTHTPFWATGSGFGFRIWRQGRAAYGAVQAFRKGYGLSDALLMTRLRRHPSWLALAEHARPLTRPEFHHIYGEVFPGARFVDDLDASVCAMFWSPLWSTPAS